MAGPARRVPVHRSGVAAVQQSGAAVSGPRWILHLPTTLTSSEAAVDLAVASRQSLGHVSVLDLGEVTLSEEDRQLLRMRVWCGLPLSDDAGGAPSETATPANVPYLPAAGAGWHHLEHDRQNRVLRPPVSGTTGPGPLGPQISLFDHALRLHQQAPDSVLPRYGEPYPDDKLHRRRSRPRAPEDRRLEGADVAAILDAHFARADAPPSELAGAFHDVYVPIHHNEHVAAAALRADEQRVQETGRWLVRHSTDQCSATVGLALLAADWTEEDIPLIQTIGLLSNGFGALAAHALGRRHTRGERALLWLAERVTGWGRVYVVEELCPVWPFKSRSWLLRHACDGDFLNGYFAGKVATAAHLDEAITSADADDELVDHTGRPDGSCSSADLWQFLSTSGQKT
jgi:hypothetical protein